MQQTTESGSGSSLYNRIATTAYFYACIPSVSTLCTARFTPAVSKMELTSFFSGSSLA